MAGILGSSATSTYLGDLAQVMASSASGGQPPRSPSMPAWIFWSRIRNQTKTHPGTDRSSTCAEQEDPDPGKVRSVLSDPQPARCEVIGGGSRVIPRFKLGAGEGKNQKHLCPREGRYHYRSHSASSRQSLADNLLFIVLILNHPGLCREHYS